MPAEAIVIYILLKRSYSVGACREEHIRPPTVGDRHSTPDVSDYLGQTPHLLDRGSEQTTRGSVLHCALTLFHLHT